MAATLIQNATVVDGTEEPRFRADVLVRDGVIARIERRLGVLAAPPHAEVIDAEGLVLSPGFIDMHSHADLRILIETDHMARINQGFTTEVLGQDGLSYAPVTDAVLPELRTKLASWNGNPDDDAFDFSWRTVAEYLDRLDEGVAVNVCYLVPHGTVRAVAAGWSDDPLTPAQLDHMCALVRQGMADGAVGLSTGLTYTPAMYADREELVRLCTVVAQQGGYFCPHTRSYGKDVLGAYREAIEIARASGCALHLTHATLNFSLNANRAPEFLQLLDETLAGGGADAVDLSLDTYPYLAGSTALAAILPSWFSSGGVDATVARLTDPAHLARLREALETTGSDGCQGVTADWDTLEIGSVQSAGLQSCVGRTIAQIARASQRDPFDVFTDILVQDRLATLILQHVGHEANVQTIMRHRCHTVGSDGLLFGTKPHPRAWGTCTRFLGHYQRELQLFSLEEAVGHMTGRSAARLRLHDRGLVREGYAADLVLFHADTVAAGASYEAPRVPSVGVEYVFVNGVAALARGKRTSALSGKSLRLRGDGTVR